jgi:hypothetical protein
MRVFATAVKLRHYRANSRCCVEIVYCLVSNFTDSHISLYLLDLFAMPSQYEPPKFTKSFQTLLAFIAQFGSSHSLSPPSQQIVARYSSPSGRHLSPIYVSSTSLVLHLTSDR